MESKKVKNIRMRQLQARPSGGFLFETFRLAEAAGKCLNWDETEFKEQLKKATLKFNKKLIWK